MNPKNEQNFKIWLKQKKNDNNFEMLRKQDLTYIKSKLYFSQKEIVFFNKNFNNKSQNSLFDLFFNSAVAMFNFLGILLKKKFNYKMIFNHL